MEKLRTINYYEPYCSYKSYPLQLVLNSVYIHNILTIGIFISYLHNASSLRSTNESNHNFTLKYKVKYIGLIDRMNFILIRVPQYVHICTIKFFFLSSVHWMKFVNCWPFLYYFNFFLVTNYGLMEKIFWFLLLLFFQL